MTNPGQPGLEKFRFDRNYRKHEAERRHPSFFCILFMQAALMVLTTGKWYLSARKASTIGR